VLLHGQSLLVRAPLIVSFEESNLFELPPEWHLFTNCCSEPPVLLAECVDTMTLVLSLHITVSSKTMVHSILGS
jgi:hypothetical protein